MIDPEQEMQYQIDDAVERAADQIDRILDREIMRGRELEKQLYALVVLLRDAGIAPDPNAALCQTRAWKLNTTVLCERNPLHGDQVATALRGYSEARRIREAKGA